MYSLANNKTLAQMMMMSDVMEFMPFPGHKHGLGRLMLVCAGSDEAPDEITFVKVVSSPHSFSILPLGRMQLITLFVIIG